MLKLLYYRSLPSLSLRVALITSNIAQTCEHRLALVTQVAARSAFSHGSPTRGQRAKIEENSRQGVTGEEWRSRERGREKTEIWGEEKEEDGEGGG